MSEPIQHISEQLETTNLIDPAPVIPEAAQTSQRSPLLTLRALLDGRQAGIVIGKAGQNVAALRLQDGLTRAGVSKAIPGVVDRVLAITGSAEALAKAYETVTLELLDQGPPDENKQATNLNTSTSIRLLIAHAQMGSVIGKQGTKIKSIQDACGVRLMATKELLPQSTERVVEISGTPAAIGKAVFEVSSCLSVDVSQAQGTILFTPGAMRPNPAFQANTNSGPIFIESAFNGVPYYNSPSFGGSPRGRRAPYSSFGGRASNSAPRELGRDLGDSQTSPPLLPDNRQPRPEPVGGSDVRTQEIAFPADMIGCIIGKGGAKISEIRKQSGSRINISKEANAGGERQFSIIGSAESNEKALYLLYSCLEAEKERRAAQPAR